MSGGMSGDGTGLGIGDGGTNVCIWSVSGGCQTDFRRGGCRGGVPDTPRVKMKIDIVSRENKILTHCLVNEKNPTIM